MKTKKLRKLFGVLSVLLLTVASIGFDNAKAAIDDDGWVTTDPGERGYTDLYYRNSVAYTYYDGTIKTHRQWKLNDVRGILDDLDVTVTKETVSEDGQIIREINGEVHYASPSRVVNEANIQSSVHALGDMIQIMSVGSEIGKYYFSYSYHTTSAIGGHVGAGYGSSMIIAKRPLNVTSADATKRDNGTPLEKNEYYINETIPDGTNTLLPNHQLKVKISGKQNTVGTSENTIEEVKVLDGNNQDVSQYYDINCVNGTLNIESNSEPVIHAQDKTIAQGETFDPLKDVSARDEEDGELEVKVIYNNVDTTKEGTYTITYEAEDKDGKKVQKTISVMVKKKDVPSDKDKEDDYIFTTESGGKGKGSKVNTGDTTHPLLLLSMMGASGAYIIIKRRIIRRK